MRKTKSHEADGREFDKNLSSSSSSSSLQSPRWSGTLCVFVNTYDEMIAFSADISCRGVDDKANYRASRILYFSPSMKLSRSFAIHSVEGGAEVEACRAVGGLPLATFQSNNRVRKNKNSEKKMDG